MVAEGIVHCGADRLYTTPRDTIKYSLHMYSNNLLFSSSTQWFPPILPTI